MLCYIRITVCCDVMWAMRMILYTRPVAQVSGAALAIYVQQQYYGTVARRMAARLCAAAACRTSAMQPVVK